MGNQHCKRVMEETLQRAVARVRGHTQRVAEMAGQERQAEQEEWVEQEGRARLALSPWNELDEAQRVYGAYEQLAARYRETKEEARADAAEAAALRVENARLVEELRMLREELAARDTAAGLPAALGRSPLDSLRWVDRPKIRHLLTSESVASLPRRRSSAALLALDLTSETHFGA